MNVEQRLRRLEIAGRQRPGYTGYQLPEGGWRWIRTSAALDAFNEACDGIDTPRARLMLTATASTSGQLHALAQSLRPE